ncbi:MAG: hypothetical protein HXO23_00310 [Prevotella sp.]|jgi:hypothetical protein|nr:hypothetical protein [Prevotella sp.]
MEEKQTYRRPYTIPKTVVIKVEFESWLLGRSLFQNPGGGGHNSAEDEDFVPTIEATGGHTSAPDEDFTPLGGGLGGHTSATDETW